MFFLFVAQALAIPLEPTSIYDREAAAFEPRAIAFFPAGLNRPDGFIQFDFTGETAARIEVRLGNFPENKGPFTYHIHQEQVQALVQDPAKDCPGAKTHLDPFNKGEKHVCDPKAPEACQIGDLAGKYGAVSNDIRNFQIFREVYQDTFLSWNRNSGSFFGNRSVVIHQKENNARIACANILVT